MLTSVSPFTWAGLALIWILFSWFWRDYRLDRMRQNLFAIRDELFDLAMESDGKLSFDSNAYGILRSRINAAIQYGHRLTWIDIVAAVFASRTDGVTDGSRADGVTAVFNRRSMKWNESCKTLPLELQTKLKEIESRYHFEIVEQVIFTSAFLVFSLIASILFVLAILLKNACASAVKKIFQLEVVTRAFATLETSVMHPAR